MLTRRCYQRSFLLSPCEETNEIFRYCLGLAAEKTGVLLHAVCVMSDHHHLVVTDVEGRLPEFTRELHRQTAKAINACHGQCENVWSVERCHLLELGDEWAVIRQIAYLAANPTEAGLVETPEQWPGVLYLPGDEIHIERVRRPKAYFGENSSAPAEIELRIVPPPGIADVATRVAAAVHERLTVAWAKMRDAGRAFLGRTAVLATSILERATSTEEPRLPVPQVAASCPSLRRRMLAAAREFRRAYRDALDGWREGAREVRFPVGTWWLRVFHGAAAAAPE
jgi:REP element-mobilizing transposase RayT